MRIMLFKDTDGTIKQVVNFENVTRDDLVNTLAEAEKSVETLKQAVVEYDELASDAQALDVETTDEAAAETAPVEPTPPAAPADVPAEPAVPADNLTDVPAATTPDAAPVDQPATDQTAAPTEPTPPITVQ